MKKILTVDDSKALRTVIRRSLQPFGVEILEAENGAIALDKAKADKPDLILLDFHMPVMDGFETLQVLKSEHDLMEIPVIMLTTEAGEHTVLKLIKMGVRDYIIKPFDRADILKGVNSCIKLFDSDVIPSEDEAAELASDASKTSVLVVDDKVNILNLAKSYIDEAEFTIETAQGAYSALASLKKKMPDVLFVDLDMPGMTGAELYKKIRREATDNRTLVIGMSLRTAEAERSDARRIGIRSFLLKPFSEDDVTELLNRRDGKFTYIENRDGIGVLTFPEDDARLVDVFLAAIKSEITEEINDMADEGRTRLVMNLSPAVSANISLARSLASLLAHAEKLTMDVRLVAESDEIRDGLGQYEETMGRDTFANLDEALESLQQTADVKG